MKMPRDMKWGNGEGFRNLSLVRKTCRHRTSEASVGVPTERLQQFKKKKKKKVEANDMPDKKQVSLEHDGTFLSGNRAPVPCF